MTMHFPIAAIGLTLSAFFCASMVDAQQKAPQRTHIQCNGKIKAMGRGLLHVIGEDGQQWLVSVEAKPQDISFQATTTQAFLRPRMLVQFRATLDKKGEANSPITEIRVISLREGTQLGLQQEGGFAGNELFTSEDGGAEKKKKKIVDNKQYQVAGMLTSIKDRKIQVAAGGVTIRGELAENCGVSVDISDYSFAREGDPVSLQGWQPVGKPEQIQATNVVITAEKPLLLTVEKKRRPTKGSAKEEAEPGVKKEAAKDPVNKPMDAEAKVP